MFHGNEVFYILIAGERRFRALEYLWNHGCSTCKTNHGNEQTGTCFFRHFPHGMIAANVKVGFTPYDALTDQFAENTHHRPKPDEEAIGFRVFFQLLRVREPKLTIAEFARRIGHHEQRVRTALQYTNLPDFVQQAVAEGKITYSTAVALERYHRVRCSTEDLKYWLTRAIAEADISSAKLAGLLHEDLHHWKASQRGLFGNAITALEEQHIRRVFDRSIAKALERMEGFLYAAIHAYRERHIGFSDSPFAAGSVRRAVLKIYRLLETLLPEIREGYTRRETEEIESIRSTLEDDLNWLEQHQED
jgi:predicted DNA-binding transcriptional regulator